MPSAAALFRNTALLLILVMRLLSPPGMMPVVKDMTISVGFCSEDPSVRSITINIDRETGDHDASKAAGHCPFVAAAAAILLPTLPPLITPFAYPSTRASTPLAFIIPGQGLAAPPPFATGPPSIL